MTTRSDLTRAQLRELVAEGPAWMRGGVAKSDAEHALTLERGTGAAADRISSDTHEIDRLNGADGIVNPETGVWTPGDRYGMAMSDRADRLDRLDGVPPMRDCYRSFAEREERLHRMELAAAAHEPGGWLHPSTPDEHPEPVHEAPDAHDEIDYLDDGHGIGR
jgi:hypothetical protein